MKTIVRIALAATLAVAPFAASAAGDWTGVYAGAQVGINSANANGLSTEQGLTAGVYGGYDYQLMPFLVVGGNLFWNWNQSKSHTIKGTSSQVDAGTNTYGGDLRAGFPIGSDGAWMPYGKLGYGWAEPTGDLTGGSWSAWRFGGGVVWRMHRNFSLDFQYIHQNLGSGSGDYTNDNFTVGASWHF